MAPAALHVAAWTHGVVDRIAFVAVCLFGRNFCIKGSSHHLRGPADRGLGRHVAHLDVDIRPLK
jgi:hypothetical protein